MINFFRIYSSENKLYLSLLNVGSSIFVIALLRRFHTCLPFTASTLDYRHHHHHRRRCCHDNSSQPVASDSSSRDSTTTNIHSNNCKEPSQSTVADVVCGSLSLRSRTALHVLVALLAYIYRASIDEVYAPVNYLLVDIVIYRF